MISLLRRRGVRWTLGFAVAFLGLLLGGEIYLRWFPPRDFQEYLGNESPLRGPFQSSPTFGVQYRDWPTFVADYGESLTRYQPFPSDPKQSGTWAMFGNSFVQAPGMLADTARRELPERVIFSLGRNELLSVRFAQIQLLLENGFKPERILVVLLPLDAVPFHRHALEQFHINDQGAITYRVRNPGGLVGWCLDHSRLAMTGWMRTSLHHAVPYYNQSRLMDGVTDSVLQDFRTLFTNLHRITQSHGVPVTVVLIPNFEQITKGASFHLQDQLTAVFRDIGFDVCDTRQAFLDVTDKKGLFIPDKHFSEHGNFLLLQHICNHFGEPIGEARRSRKP